MVAQKLTIPVLAAVMLLQSCSLPAHRSESSTPNLSRNFAFMVCLGTASEGQPIAEDFNRAATGYMERSDISIEQIGEVRALVKTWLAKDYPSKHGGQVNTAKCVDMYHSNDLTEVLK